MLILSSFACFLIFLPDLAAYEETVHIALNRRATEESNLNTFLSKVLRLSHGIRELLEEQEIVWWIEYGGETEDYGKKGKNDILSTRGFNHFHDPLKDWDSAGLDHDLNVLYTQFYRGLPVSALIWALNPGEQQFEQNRQYPDLDRPSPSDWSWGIFS